MLYDVIVIGAGVTGCAAAMELTRFDLRVAVLEKEEDVCCGTSKANSAIVHAGFDARPGTNKARFNVLGSKRMPALCRELDVPYRNCGALVLCFDEADRPRLEELLRRGEANGVDVRIVEKDGLRALEPNVSDAAVAALYAPTSAIVCPFELTAAMAENAAANGAEFFFDTPVRSIAPFDAGWRVLTDKGPFEAKVVVNAAGLYSGELHNMVSENKLTVTPRKGEYVLLDKKAGGLVSRTIFQVPGPMGKGVLVTPTVHGNLLAGPTAVDVPDPQATNTTQAGIDDLLARARQSVPTLPVFRTITGFAGLRAHVKQEGGTDFILGPVEDAPGFLDAVGIESPGLSAAPAIGEYLAAEAAKYLSAGKNESYRPGREPVYRPNEMPWDQRVEFIKAHPAYGQIICRCEQVSEGEIVAAIHRKPGARSLDGVKRRTRAGMGRCQAGFCSPRVLEILSRELGVPQEELTKSGGASRPIVGFTREGGAEE